MNIYSISVITTLLFTSTHKCNGLLLSPFLSKTTRSLSFPPKPLKPPTNCALNMGGYDATVGSVDPSTPLQFFTLPGNTCPYAARTLITLHELNIPFDTTEVSGRPKPDWYLKINPRGKVPAVRIPAYDNGVVYESSICNEFLCDYYDYAFERRNDERNDLMPRRDPMARAKIRLLNDHCDSVFLKTQFTFLMNKNETLEVGLTAEMETALLVFEEALENNGGGPFFLGDVFTLSDVHLVPFILRLVVTLRHWKNYELPPDKFPKLLAWYDACSQRHSVMQGAITKEKIIEIYKMFVEVDYSFGGLNNNK